MSAGDLKQVLDTAQRAVLRRFLYYHAGNLAAGEWAVISDKCGQLWRPLESMYWPADQAVL